MRSTWIVLLIAVAQTHAFAQSAAAHAVQPLWPPDCTRDMPRDGLVLLDPRALGLAAPAEPATAAQTLEIRLLRTSDGTAVAGTLEAPEPGPDALLRWHSQAPLHANTEYKIEARHLATQAMALSGYFTTGASFLAPLAFSGRPALRLMARAPEPDGAQVESVLVRIALPPLTGGLAQRALQVSVAWAEADDNERAAGLRGGHEQAAVPGEMLGFELEAQLRDAPSERCLEIVARDDLGQEVAVDPALCVSLPARSASEPPDARAQADGTDATDQDDRSDVPAPDATASEHDEPLEPAQFETLSSQQSAAEATQPSQSEGAAAGGCSLSSRHGGPSWAWLLAALPAVLRRRRQQFYPGNIDGRIIPG